jgi:hypothetical protein
MTIYEAIQVLKSTPIHVVIGNDAKYGEARQLGIQALENEVRLRETRKLWAEKLLPGETRE